MIRPPSLQHGDKVAIVAPARKLPKVDLDAAAALLRQWGLDVTIGANALSQHHAYLSGTDEQRLHDIQAAINDSKVKAIFAARGGYGTTRILDQIDLSPLKANPKYIVGFSDITSLHLKLFGEGFESIHGTMPVLFERPGGSSSLDSLKNLLFNGDFVLNGNHSPSNIPGSATGRLIGGNLSIIAESLGTSSSPDTNGCILVIEEIDEFKYRLDRMLTTLRRADKLKGLAALVVGHMTAITDSELAFGESVEEMVANAVRDYQFPIAFGMPTGHDQPNIAWRHGSLARLVVNENGSTLFPSGQSPEEKISQSVKAE